MKSRNCIPIIHGGMKYRCDKCGEEWFMNLELGVEDFGVNGREHQPCPYVISCECGGFARDISGYIPLPEKRPIMPGMAYFAYDKSRKSDACGIPKVYETTNINDYSTSLSVFKRLLKNAASTAEKAREAEKAVFDALDRMGIHADDVPTDAENADNLSDAISCFINYNEYSLSGIMKEVQCAHEKEVDL